MKKEKVKINVKERLEDNVLDLSLSGEFVKCEEKLGIC
jgi:hypothetical protein